MTLTATINLYQRVAEAAGEWRRSRRLLAHALTSQRFNGSEAAAIRQRHDQAADALDEAVDALDDVTVPAVGETTVGQARRVTQIEGEIVLCAIGWLHALDQFDAADEINAAQIARCRVEASEEAMRTKVCELVDELAALGAITA